MGRRQQKLEEERNYDLVVRKRRETGNFFKSFLKFTFSHVGLVLLCVVIAVGGAEIFINIEIGKEEERYEDKRARAKEVNNAQEYLSNVFWWYAQEDEGYNFTQEQFTDRVESDLLEFIDFVVNATNEVSYDGEVEGWTYDWDFPNALLFTISIMTLIGYGHISPVTIVGKLFTIGYSLIAIATMLVMLANVGSALADGLIYTYSRCCCRWFRSQRINSEIPSRTLRKKLRRRLIDEVVGDEMYMPTNTIAIPIIVNVVIIFFYIFLGAMLFSIWEGWDLTSSAYFAFITLTTVGFGDLSPDKSFRGTGAAGTIIMICSIIYCSIGLAVLSLCISLIQEQISKKAARALHGKVEVVEMDRIEIIPKRINIQGDVDAIPHDDKAGLIDAEVPMDEIDNEDEASVPMDLENENNSRPSSGKLPGETDDLFGDVPEQDDDLTPIDP